MDHSCIFGEMSIHALHPFGGWFVCGFVVVSSRLLYSKLQTIGSFSEYLKSSFLFITRTPGQPAGLSGSAELLG